MVDAASDVNDSAWRPAFAALSNAITRQVYAQIVLDRNDPGSDLSPSRRRHAIDTLLKAGLIEHRDGRYVAGDDVFSRILRAAPQPVRRHGIGRFLTVDGRIDRYPAAAAERRQLLEHVAAEVLAPGEVVSEPELNERLVPFDSDVALLRRYLVDHELLERSRNGSEYVRPASDA